MKRLLTALFLISFTSLSYGRMIDSTKDRIEILNDFSGGLNTQKATHKLDKNQTPAAENGYIDDKPGSIVKRNGFTVVGSTTGLSKINLMKEFALDDGTRGMFISDSSRVLYTTDFMNYVIVKSTLTTSGKLRAVQGRGIMLFTNGVDPVFISSGLVGIPLDGTNGRPNVPRGKFPAFFQERFWVLNTTDSCGSVNFQALTSTDGFIITVDDPRAWPVLNQINIGRGDGRCGSGLDVYRGQLQAHKDNSSIYTIFGTDEFTYQARRTNAFSGTVAADSIVQGDNLEYYFAKDGVNAFDGADSLRISDDILPDMQSVVSNLTSIQDNTWDTQSQFNRGGTFQNSTSTADGFVSILATVTIGENIIPNVDGWINTLASGSSSSTLYQTISSALINTASFNYSGFISNGAINTFTDGGCTNANVLTMMFLNRRTGVIAQTTPINRGSISSLGLATFTLTGFDVTATDIRNSNIAAKLAVDGSAGCTISFSSFSRFQGGHISLNITTNTGSYITEVTTITPITFWDSFLPTVNLDGGNIYWYIKGATSPVNIGTETWISISPGNIPALPVSKNYIQIASTINATGLDTASGTYIDSIVLKHNEGGSSDTAPFGVSWKKRYWLAVTTQASGTSTIIYVKSKITNSTPNAWMKFTGFYIKSMAQMGDIFYAGSGNSGTIYRMDYGSNDNGSAINWYYDTPDMILGDNFFEKKLFEYMVDVQRESGATLSVGTSKEGSSFSNNSTSLNGSGRLLSTIENVPYQFGKYFRFRFSNSELDKNITFNTFGIVYQPTVVFQSQGQ